MSINQKIVLVGDMNIDLLSNEPASVALLEIAQVSGCENIISVPTRITERTESLIDICLTNHQKTDVFSGVLTADLSDHLPFFCFFPQHNSQHKLLYKNPVFFRLINATTLQDFYNLVSTENWDDVFKEPNPTKSYDIFISKLQEYYNKAFPKAEIKKT